MDKKSFFNSLTQRMDGALKVLDNELKGLRTGRASANLLDPIQIEAYGQRMPISQVATVSTPDARTIVVQVWDKSMVKPTEKAIADANLGINPVAEGQLIRLPIPPLNEERRKELVKLAGKYAENTKVSIRNIRRDGMEDLKKLEKNGEISKDEHKNIGEEIQKFTDDYISKIEKNIKQKEQEIMVI